MCRQHPLSFSFYPSPYLLPPGASMTQVIPTREHFEKAYQGQAPWDVPRPQPVFVQAAAEVTGRVLDSGCGTGENALYFASRGQQVTGIDYLEEPIARARRKAD